MSMNRTEVCKVKRIGVFVNPSRVIRRSQFNFNCILLIKGLALRKRARWCAATSPFPKIEIIFFFSLCATLDSSVCIAWVAAGAASSDFAQLTSPSEILS